MMKCAITGVMTKNKWRGIPLCKEIIDQAKELVIEHESKGPRAGMTLRKALIMLQEEWKKERHEMQNANS